MIPSWFSEIRGRVPRGSALFLGLLPIVAVILIWTFVTRGAPEERVLGPTILPSPAEVISRLDELVTTSDPDGRTLFYIAGSHGDEVKGGMQIMRYDIAERKRTSMGFIGRENIPAFYCYGATFFNGLIYFNVHGGDPSNSYLLVFDPNDNRIASETKS